MHPSKWLCLFALTGTLSPALAQTPPPPRIAYGSVHTNPSGEQQLELNEGSYHASRRQSLCWVAENIGSTAAQTVVEHIQTPPQTDIPETENTRVVSNPDRSSHTITTRKTPNATGQYHTCWHFGANDPFGDYRLQVHIGDITFPPYPFRWQP
ncbi:hypothetical protein [Conchiformibius kuhniae]|uniref:Uncharacterized protein n=1 Tax=Conchiformibius kuhniae TaxID=211502 RepID=A0ABD8B8F5_9NEIS|nr:hypothetical protein [Conchiformibius kuhniae]